jgi:hypothetical protein
MGIKNMKNPTKQPLESDNCHYGMYVVQCLRVFRVKT